MKSARSLLWLALLFFSNKDTLAGQDDPDRPHPNCTPVGLVGTENPGSEEPKQCAAAFFHDKPSRYPVNESWDSC
ncbi:hypothetical protein Vi05172_g8122 [Venturia inaequalis]|nr:hypothetical protein Vi05172_g8122 [Venturia inaequalis]